MSEANQMAKLPFEDMDEPLPPEADVIMDGTRLSPAHVMAVRVACAAYHADMQDPLALGDDEHGKRMTVAYRDRLAEVLRLLC